MTTSHPSLPIGQQITFLYTLDLTASSLFYEDILGLSLWLDQGTCRIYHVCAGSYIGICQVSEHSKGRLATDVQHNVIITLVTPEVDAWYDRLQQRGVIFEKPPEFNPHYSIYHCFLHDPNGYLIEIQDFRQSP